MSSETKRKRIVLSDDENELPVFTPVVPVESSTLPHSQSNSQPNGNFSQKSYSTRSSFGSKKSKLEDMRDHIRRYSQLGIKALQSESESDNSSEEDEDDSNDKKSSDRSSDRSSDESERRTEQPKQLSARLGGMSTSGSKFFRDSQRSSYRADDAEDRYQAIYDNSADIKDFIVNDDDEVEEEEDSESEEETLPPRKKKNDSNKVTEITPIKPQKKRFVIIEEEEDDNDDKNGSKNSIENEEDKIVMKGIMSSSSRRRIIDDDDENESLSQNEEEDNESETNGISFYARIDAQLDKQRHVSRSSLQDASEALTGHRFSFERPQAFRFYVEYLGYTILNLRGRFDTASFSDITKTRYEIAVKKIEDLLCTTRESLLGSAAWQKDYLAELQSKPFAKIISSSSRSVDHSYHNSSRSKCSACGKTSKYTDPEYTVSFSGKSYEAKSLYTSYNWQRYLPKDMFRDPVSDDDDGDDDDDDDEQKEDSIWHLTTHCKDRTLTYHKYLHYKLSLMIKIQKKLKDVFDWDIEAFKLNEEFFEEEYKRYVRLVDRLKARYAIDNQGMTNSYEDD